MPDAVPEPALPYSLRAAYSKWARAIGPSPPARGTTPLRPGGRIGIIGAGMAGLYAALLLRGQGHEVTILEASPGRVGGRIMTHRFSSRPEQYFEAGAMRLPLMLEHQPVFDLIDFLNTRGGSIELLDYVLCHPQGNRVLVNGARDRHGRVMTVEYAEAHPEELGFGLPLPVRTARQILDRVTSYYVELLKRDFAKGFRALIQYDDWSFYSYLTTVCGWSPREVDYVEVMTSQTNQFQASFPEIVMENVDFAERRWKTVKDGMDRLPAACARVIGHDRFLMGAHVHALQQHPSGVTVHYTDGGAGRHAHFDKIIVAVPPAVVRMWHRPRWSPDKERAIRAMNYQPLYKVGLRFAERFWERGDRPAHGGQSITDLPSRWVVYPSNGISTTGPGVLLQYAWMTDAYTWLPQDRDTRVARALYDLQLLHPEVDVHSLFIEAHDVTWSTQWAAGDAKFLPGQFRELFTAGQSAESDIHFAGEHLSVHHTWILGALDSARVACRQITGRHLPYLSAADGVPG
ncbi:flavin monoamine oxidase family protein [Streptomyces silvensis]|uniref:Amine oxidase domain-containing protein n=1 Tax=Streptomyces silvensis TaxID=1765722 RepID=A0A0W7X5K5_9ACTN|nr:NAD(P)/FAD-dependent oxidoreductase [Streptomyces silvensis]KUF18169.1 hypothetical protein AT728_24625 [Streptomyces silvensis]